MHAEFWLRNEKERDLGIDLRVVKKELRWGDVKWIDLSQVRENCLDLVYIAKAYEGGIPLISQETLTSKEGRCFMELFSWLHWLVG